jgi:mannosyltransferase OCH1-like enzyme
MHPSNRLIQGLWIGSKLSVMEQLSIQSFRQNGHDYHLYVYEDVRDVPKGVQLMDARSILPADRIFTYQHGAEQGSYSGFADAFRWHLLAEKGGWWADLDVVCLKPFDFPDSHIIASSHEGKWGNPAINCVMKMPANSDLATYLCRESDRYDPQQIRFTETGPLLLQRGIAALGLDSAIVAHDIFCAISWRSVQQKIAYTQLNSRPCRWLNYTKDYARGVLKPAASIDRLRRHSAAIHLWSEMWRREQLDKNATYHPSCLYERLKQVYL